MQKNVNNGQNGAATSAVKYVDNFSNELVWVFNRDHRTRGGSFNWQIDAVKMIVDYFTFVDTDTDSLNVSVLVYGNQITVKAEFNGKEYRYEKPITAETGKKEIKRILDDMGVVEDVIKRDTEKMMEKMMKQDVRDYFVKNNDERAYFVLPDYDYVCGLFIEYNEDDDIYVAMGDESWNVTEYDGDTDMSVVIADFSNAWAKDIDDYCDLFKGLDCDRKIYRNDDYDGYMILLNSGVSQGLNVEEGYDPYKGYYVEVIA